VVDIIRKYEVLSHFPGMTEADLYLWVMDHRHQLSESAGQDVGPEAAVTDLDARFGRHTLAMWWRHAAGALKARLRALFGRQG
jgi:hypothetical protein